MAKRKKRKTLAVDWPPPMADAELRLFVLAWCDGRIYSSKHVPPDLLGMVFMPLALGAFADNSKAEIKRVALIYSEQGKHATAGRRSINGFPMFMEFAVMNHTDWARAADAITIEQARREAIKV